MLDLYFQIVMEDPPVFLNYRYSKHFVEKENTARPTIFNCSGHVVVPTSGSLVRFF